MNLPTSYDTKFNPVAFLSEKMTEERTLTSLTIYDLHENMSYNKAYFFLFTLIDI